MDIITKVESRVKDTIKKYKIANKKDKIVVALSGGKDSAVTAYLLKKLGYNIEGFHIDLKMGKYSDECLDMIKKLCDDHDIPLHVYDMKKEMGAGMCYLRSGVQAKWKKGQIKNCAICGVLKKWIMNKAIRKLKFDKIATGHNLDDESQTFFMNILKGSPKLSANSGPITRNSPNKKFTPRIKPLFFVDEADIREYSKKLKLPVSYKSCPCAIDSYRIQVRTFMHKEMTEKEKLNLLKSFEGMIDKIHLKRDTRMLYCENCGEPARKKLCKTCELMSLCK